MSSKLHGQVWECEIQPISRKAVIARLADFSSDEGYSWPSVDTIRRQVGAKSKNTVTAAIKELEKDGWLTVIPRKAGGRDISNGYQLNVEKIEAAADESRQSVRQARAKVNSKFNPSNIDPSDSDHSKTEWSKKVKSGGQNLEGEGSTVDPDPLLDPTTDPSDKKPSCPDASQPDGNTSPNDFITRHPEAVVYSQAKRQWGTQDDLTCAEYIWKRIVRMYEHAAETDGELTRPKEPNWTAWANEVRLMRVQDLRTHKQICELFLKANKDPFWCKNILSPSKLREKWDELVLKLGSLPVSSRQPGRVDTFKGSYDGTDYSQVPEGFRS